MIKRRSIVGAATAMAWPSVLRAQPKPIPTIGVLSSGAPGAAYIGAYADAFRRGLAEQGYVEGQTVAFDYRWADGRYDRLPELAAELVARKVDVIVASGVPDAHAARKATATIPIAYVGGADLVGERLVDSLARPGGNLTGIAILNVELTAKRLELLGDLIPQARTVAVLINPGNPVSARVVRDARATAERRQLRLEIVEAVSEATIDTAFAAMAAARVDALLVGTDPYLGSRRAQLVEQAARHAVPMILGFATEGALISYGPSIVAAFHQLGVYVGRILKGARPADLPVEQATAFELVIDLRTARALGLTVPQRLLLSATEVIE